MKDFVLIEGNGNESGCEGDDAGSVFSAVDCCERWWMVHLLVRFGVE